MEFRRSDAWWGTPRRQSLPSSMSSWTRNPLCSISRPAAAGSASSRPPAERSRGRDAQGRAQTFSRSLEENRARARKGGAGALNSEFPPRAYRSAFRGTSSGARESPPVRGSRSRPTEARRSSMSRPGARTIPRTFGSRMGSPAPSSRTLGRARSPARARSRRRSRTAPPVQPEDAPLRGAVMRLGWRGLRPA